MNSVDLGKRIKKLRTEKQLSLRALATLSGITASLLSQIERGKANPSLQTLKNLSSALQVPLFAFFLEQDTTEELVVRSNCRRVMTLPGCDGIIYELLSPVLTGDIELALFRIKEGGTTEKMSHDGEEAAVVVRGEVIVEINGKDIYLNEGDSVRIPSHYIHYWRNESAREAEIVFAVTPPKF